MEHVTVSDLLLCILMSFCTTSSLTWHVDHPLAEAGERPTKSSHIKILVQIRHAPARVSSPQKLHTISAAPGDFTSASTKPGDAKMPEPITMPTMKDTDDRSLLIPTRTVSGASAKRVNSESQARGKHGEGRGGGPWLRLPERPIHRSNFGGHHRGGTHASTLSWWCRRHASNAHTKFTNYEK